tara:strand:- start:240 stop:947 length:708 start_codon:yes stop_codon:yes gene_type:complete
MRNLRKVLLININEKLTKLRAAKSRILQSKGVQLVLSVAGLVILIMLIQKYGMEPLRDAVKSMGIWAPLGIFILRSISTIFPIISNLPYAILAGSVLDFKTAYITIFLADFISCQVAFLIARNLGREPVRSLVGIKAMNRIESFNKNQLEGNFFLMTGVLMTGLFDFLSYGLGLGATPWRLFTSALLLCLVIFDAVAVAIGAGLAGYINVVIAMVGMFGLAIITGLTKKIQQKSK